jgi:hypothetical protein
MEYPGAMYRAISRRNRRQDIYLDDVDRQEFERRMEAQRLGPGDEESLKALRRRNPQTVRRNPLPAVETSDLLKIL